MTTLAGRKVMIVEDLFYLAMDVKAALMKVGAEALGPFPTARAALEGLNATLPDCGLLDVNLGDGASFEVARALKARDVPFLFFTGYDASAIPAEFEQVQRLEKPVETKRLIQAVARCLE